MEGWVANFANVDSSFGFRLLDRRLLCRLLAQLELISSTL